MSSSLFSGSARRAATSLDFRTRPVRRRARLAADLVTAPLRRADIAVFHEFLPPPTGGGTQFLRGLLGELRNRGVRVAENRIARGTRACLYNSFNFDFDRLRAFAARAGCRMVHRVDGPVGVYRGFDDGTDQRIWEINRELADATIFQSRYSLERHRELGLDFARPTVIRNAPDPAIFHAQGRGPSAPRGKVRVIATSWSANPNKGAPLVRRLESLLDWSRYELTFVGRSPIDFERVRRIPAVPSHELAGLFRAHDVVFFAARHEACPNALLEALACGLPAVYVRSGSSSEVVGQAGLGFDDVEEVPALLDRLVDEYERRQAAIEVPSLAETADRYLEVLGVEP